MFFFFLLLGPSLPPWCQRIVSSNLQANANDKATNLFNITYA